MDFINRTCVITGGANGIGRCIAERFLDAGTRVAVIDPDEAAGNRLAARFSPARFLYFPGDIAEQAVLERFAAVVLERFRRVDCLIHNACVSRQGILSGCSYADFVYVQRVGVIAPYYLTSLFRDHFAPGASVVNIASTRAVMSQADTESYTAAKGGIRALTHALSVSLAGTARVNSVSPGWIDTAAYHLDNGIACEQTPADRLQHPVGRVGAPDDIANIVLFLCSDQASFLTGQDITVDGGMTTQMIYHADCSWTYDPEERT